MKKNESLRKGITKRYVRPVTRERVRPVPPFKELEVEADLHINVMPDEDVTLNRPRVK